MTSLIFVSSFYYSDDTLSKLSTISSSDIKGLCCIPM